MKSPILSVLASGVIIDTINFTGSSNAKYGILTNLNNTLSRLLTINRCQFSTFSTGITGSFDLSQDSLYQKLWITNCVFVSCDTGCSLYNTYSALIANNCFHSCDTSIQIGNLNKETPRGVTIANNCIYGTGYDGINISYGSRSVVIGNVISGGLSYPIQSSGDVGCSLICGNVIYDGVHGIAIGMNRTLCIGNYCYQNDIGIRIMGANCAIIGNVAYRGTGISSDYSSSQYGIKTDTTYEGKGINNLIANNYTMGKAVVTSGTGNTADNNKY